jgi:hypothetical protein
MADRTATFVLDRAAALGAGAAFVTGFLYAGIIACCMHVRLDRLGDRIGAG